MLAAVESDLQRRLRSRALEDGRRRKLNGSALVEPALDVVEASLAAQLMESSEVLKGRGREDVQRMGVSRDETQDHQD